jgi:diguanylate cyclase
MSSARKQAGADRRIYLGDTIVEELRTARLPLEPRHFEFWFAYKSGRNSALTAAADEIKARNGALSGTDINRLHGDYLSPWRLGEQPDAVAARLTAKLQDLSVTLEEAIGSTQTHQATLVAETAGLSISSALTLQDVLSAIDRLTGSTKESQLRYALLDARMDAMSREIGALKQQLAAVRTECQADPVTALPNRAIFDAALASALTEAAETRQPVSVVLCNLDYFAAFNENFGTHLGDQVLRSIGMLFKAHMRATDTVARFGGDEYAAVLPQLRASEAVACAERFRQVLMMHELVGHPNGAGRVRASVGVADAIKGDTPEFLLRRVANGLKIAKREGRNRVVEMSPDGPIWDAERRA